MAGPDGFSPEDNSQLYCLREGLVNLLAHADYFSPMHSTIRVFSNRIEFQNPGRFAVRISDKPGKVKSVPRNPNIIAFFRYARQGENAGYGIDKIMRWTKLTGLNVEFEGDVMSSTLTYPLPILNSSQINDINGGQISYDFPNHFSDVEEDTYGKGGQKGWSEKVVRKDGRKDGDETRVMIIDAIRNNPEVTRKELSEIIGISSSAIQKHIEYLKYSGVIVRIGSDRKGWWKIV